MSIESLLAKYAKPASTQPVSSGILGNFSQDTGKPASIQKVSSVSSVSSENGKAEVKNGMPIGQDPNGGQEKNQPETACPSTMTTGGMVGHPPPLFEGSPAVLSDVISHHTELMTERAAIREYDGGHPRTDAEYDAAVEVGPCYACGGEQFWVSRWGVITCSRCHPPADHRLIERTITLGRRNLQ